MTTRVLLAALCVLSSIASASAAPQCSVPYIRLLGNQAVPGTMYASSGRPCSVVLLHSSGPIVTTEIVQKANNGSVVLSGNRLTYTSRPGFVGDDRFTYARHGQSGANQPMVWTVDMTVHVATHQ